MRAVGLLGRIAGASRFAACVLAACVLAASVLAACALAACAPPTRDVFGEAEALVAEGKPGEAALRFATVCALAPTSARCPEAEARAVALRIAIAERALAEQRFAAAERALLDALGTATDAERATIAERLRRADLVNGLRWERALATEDRAVITRAAEELARGEGPIAEAARARLTAERPATLIRAVNDACGPTHQGSCTRARAQLRAAAIEGPEAAAALALAATEEARIAPLQRKAEGLLTVFAAEGRKHRALERCLSARSTDTPDQGQLHETCEEEAFGTEPPAELYQRRRNAEALFRRALAAIADPAPVKDLQDRRAEALAQGTVKKLGTPEAPPTSP